MDTVVYKRWSCLYTHILPACYFWLHLLPLVTQWQLLNMLLLVTLAMSGWCVTFGNASDKAVYGPLCLLILKDLRIAHYQHRNYGCLTTICSGALS